MIHSSTFLEQYLWSIVFFMVGILQIYPTFASLRPPNRGELKLMSSTYNILSISSSFQAILFKYQAIFACFLRNIDGALFLSFQEFDYRSIQYLPLPCHQIGGGVMVNSSIFNILSISFSVWEIS